VERGRDELAGTRSQESRSTQEETMTGIGSNHGHVATPERQHRATPTRQENPAQDWRARDQEWWEDQPRITCQVRLLLQGVYVAHFQHC
jgi:hypothetical protein